MQYSIMELKEIINITVITVCNLLNKKIDNKNIYRSVINRMNNALKIYFLKII